MHRIMNKSFILGRLLFIPSENANCATIVVQNKGYDSRKVGLRFSVMVFRAAYGL